MIIWIIAVLMITVLALIGNFQGGIKVAFSLIGLLVGALLSMPLAPIFQPIVGIAGVQHPILKQILAPFLGFLMVLIAFKVLGHVVHRKVEHYYKYKVGEVLRLKWERLNQKLGLTLGVMNGAVYFFLLMIPIYVFGYLTTQLATGEEDPRGMKFVNQARTQLQGAKLDKVVAAYDPAPSAFYDASDVLGLVKHNPLLESRLSRYPAFLALAEEPHFQAMAADAELQNLIASQAKIGDVIKHPKVQAVLTNAEINTKIMHLLGSDMKDLRQFVETGKSAKYDDEKILGRWDIDLNATVDLEKKKHSEMSGLGLKQLRSKLVVMLSGTIFIATTDNKAFLKRYGNTVETVNQTQLIAQGSWKREGDTYEVTLEQNGKSETVKITIEGENRLQVPTEAWTLVFDRET